MPNHGAIQIAKQKCLYSVSTLSLRESNHLYSAFLDHEGLAPPDGVLTYLTLLSNSDEFESKSYKDV